MTLQISNDIPEIFLEIAKEAIGLGFSEVSLGFMYMDSDFVSPIEWALWLHKRESKSSAREHVVLTMGRSDEEEKPQAYIPSATGDYRDSTYWGPEGVRPWMREPLEAEGEYVAAWSPVIDQTLRERLLGHWELFELGVRNGWTMKHRVHWEDLHSINRTLETMGQTTELTPRRSLEWSISNSFYNIAGHPDHHSTGAEVSLMSFGSIGETEGENYSVPRLKDGVAHLVAIEREQVVKLLSSPHRWFVRVAYNDEENERWLHYPEALKPASDTIDFKGGEGL